jgi:hypothetical protein
LTTTGFSDDHGLFEAVLADGDGAEDLAHPALRQALLEHVAAEGVHGRTLG